VRRLPLEHGPDADLGAIMRGLTGDCPHRDEQQIQNRCDPYCPDLVRLLYKLGLGRDCYRKLRFPVIKCVCLSEPTFSLLAVSRGRVCGSHDARYPCVTRGSKDGARSQREACVLRGECDGRGLRAPKVSY
jgi:hypothetical protein